MSGRGAAIFLGAVAAIVIVAPALGLRNPNEQPDTLVLRELPPLSRPHAVRLADGRTLFGDRVRETAEGVRLERGSSERRIARAELAGPDAADWHRRPLYLLGTDRLGRDLASRLVHGGRVSLVVGLAGAFVALVLGTLVGTTAGLAGGAIDGLLMRLTDVALSVPRLFLAMLLVALWSPSLATTVVVLGATTWMAAARLVRGEILSLRERDYVLAARAAGARGLRLGLRHLLPGALAPLVVETTLRVGDTMLLEAALSFLDLGVRPPTPSWGNLVADGRASLVGAPWIATIPGLAIAATVTALHLAGEAARERLGGRASV